MEIQLTGRKTPLPRAIAVYGKAPGARRWYPVQLQTGQLVKSKRGYFSSVPESTEWLERYKEHTQRLAQVNPGTQYRVAACGSDLQPGEFLSEGIAAEKPAMSDEEQTERLLSPADMQNQDAAIAATPHARKKTRIEQVQAIVDQRAAKKVEGVIVDLFSASVYVQIRAALSDVNQAKLDAMSITKAIETCYRLAEKVSSK